MHLCRIVKLTTPNLNYFIILGSLMLNTVCALRVIQSTSLEVWFALCQVSYDTNKHPILHVVYFSR